MNFTNCQLLRTDFGHEVYDRWYLEHARHNFEAPDFVQKHFPFYEEVLQLTKHELKDSIVTAGFKDFDFYKKREIREFDPMIDSGFSVVCRK